MKKQTTLVFLLLSAFLTSCGVTITDSSSNSEPAPSSDTPSSETESESHDHEHSSESSGDDSSFTPGSSSASSEVDPCQNGHTLLHYALVNPTCTDYGYEEGWFCEVCGEYFTTKPSGTVTESSAHSHKKINPLGHHYDGEYDIIQEKTCTEDGIKERYCEHGCGEKEVVVEHSTGHDWEDEEFTTYVWDFNNRRVTGTRKRVCSIHGELVLETKTVGFASEETIDEVGCDQDGLIEYTSNSFGANSGIAVAKTTRKIDKHHTLQKVEAIASTCNTRGNRQYYQCIGGCGKFFNDASASEEIAENSWILDYDNDIHLHTEHHLAKVATCANVGWDAYDECTACGAKIGYVEHPVLDHVASGKWTSNNTHHYHLCKNCGAQLEEGYGAHDYGDALPGTEAYCTVCNFHRPAGEHECKYFLQLVSAVAPRCETAGHIQYYECACGKKYRDSAAEVEITGVGEDTEVVPATGHNLPLTVHAASVATCDVAGNSEYYSCEACGKYFSDANAEHEIAVNSWVLDPTGHTPVAHPATDAHCEESGNTLYYSCSTCGRYFSDEECEHEIAANTWVVPATGHLHLTTHPASAATCETGGNLTYYSCDDCSKLFLDAEATQETAEIPTTTVLGHNHDGHVEEYSPTCEHKGTAEYYYCTTCGTKFTKAADVYTKVNDADLVLDYATHTIVEVPAVPATCTATGKAAHYKCSVCDKLFSDALGEHEISAPDVLPIAPTNHDGHLEHIEATTATCISTGNSEYYHCTACNKYYSNAAGTAEIEEDSWVIAIDANNHVHTEAHSAQAATCTAAGHTAYQVCSDCNAVIGYSVIPATGHTQSSTWSYDSTGHYHECSVCHVKLDETFEAHDFGDVPSDQQATCSVCGFVRPAGEHDCNDYLHHAEAVAPQCEKAGNIEYWYCDCGKKYSSSTASSETLLIEGAEVVAATGHLHLTIHAATEPTCEGAGNNLYYSCDDCGKYFSDANAEHEIAANSWVLDPTGHTYQGVAEVPATCTTDGVAAHYTCEDCDKLFIKDNNNQYVEVVADDLVIPAHHTYVYETGTPATCASTGIAEHYSCSGCDKLFTRSGDVYTEVNAEALVTEIDPHNHDGHCTFVEAKDATCGQAGNLAHYYCDACEKYFSDSKGTTEVSAASVIIPKLTTHTWGEWDVTVAATCTTTGSRTRTCSVCHEVQNEVIDATGHHFVHVYASAATCTTNGNIEYWYCDHDCGEYYSDEGRTQKITQEETVVEALGHDYRFVKFNFSEDGKTYTVSLKCHNDELHESTTLAADSSSSVLTPATCENKGTTRYSASYEDADGVHEGYVDKQDIPALGHTWGDISVVWTEDHTSVTLSRTCSRCNEVETETKSASSTVTTAPTCTEAGVRTYTSQAFTNPAFEVQQYEEAVAALGHGWVGPTNITWNSGKTQISESYVCNNDSSHSKVENPYTKPVTNQYVSENIRSELASNFAAGYKDSEKYGDVNLFFKYKSASEGQKDFDFEMALRINRDSGLSSMSDLFILRIDNSYKYGSGGSGSSYGLFTSDLSAYSNKYTASCYDNRTDYTSALVGADFETDFKIFAKNVVLVIRGNLNTSNNTITVTVTYYTLDDTYAAYLGYTQTYKAIIDDTDVSWNTTNSIKFARQRVSGQDPLASTMTVESITLNHGEFDHDVETSYYNGKNWLQQETFRVETVKSK